MDPPGFAFFDTGLGRCAIVWSAAGIVGLQLPEASDETAMWRLARRFPGAAQAAPTQAIAAAIARIQASLDGAADDLASLALDESDAGEFDRAVYREARAIPAGATSTYGAIAARLGDPALARAVGQSLGRNPWPIVVPCHRVTGADGKMGGFSAPGGRATKRRLLELEGALGADSLPLFAASDPPS